ncbi:sensor histidine kinase [Streptomyces lushanensis]|uniref:sensor histidine kinase n=1 Tax=Streptomyces lushanensis TaxID=1434255 RepID=UPI003CCBE518
MVRVVQEALRNIEKHAHARTAALRVVEDGAAPGTPLIEVADDGESFAPGMTGPAGFGLPGTAGAAGFGLTSIRERAAGHGGSVEIRTDSRPSTCCGPSTPSAWSPSVCGSSTTWSRSSRPAVARRPAAGRSPSRCRRGGWRASPPARPTPSRCSDAVAVF